MAEAVTERPIHQPPVMHFSGVGAAALAEGGFLPPELLINPYRDDNGKLKCDGMAIPADIFTRSIQRVLRDDFIHSQGEKQDQLGEILYSELGGDKNEERSMPQDGPTTNVKRGLDRYAERLKSAKGEFGLNHNDITIIQEAVRDRLSILQGLIHYQHIAIRTLPPSIAIYIQNPEQIQQLTTRLAELDKQKEDLLIDEQPTAQLPTISPLSATPQFPQPTDEDRRAFTESAVMFPED